MSKFSYPRMRIRMLIPARKAPRMRIHMRMPVQEDLRKRIPVSRYPRMRIFVTYLNSTSYCQMEAAFITEYRFLHYTEY